MEYFLINLCNGISYGFLLFLLSAGLTLIFSFLGVLNFAHASFYMLGAYLGFSISEQWGYWWGLLLAPVFTGVLGILVERYALRRLHAKGQLAELLFTFGLTYFILEIVQLIWGKFALAYRIPDFLQLPLFTIYSSPFSRYRGLIALLTLVVFAAMYLLLQRTRLGLIIRASLTHPEMVQALGHNVPQIFMWIFSAGCGLAGLAGAVGGNLLVTEPGMAASVGSILFVIIVIGGIGSLKGALIASMFIAILQSFAVSAEVSIGDLLGMSMTGAQLGSAENAIRLSQIAPALPYLFLLGMLIWRPQGLFAASKTSTNHLRYE